MTTQRPARRYRFGVFEVDAATGELRRRGIRVKLHAQPFHILTLLLERPGEMVTREQICRILWPDGTFVDFEHGVNSAVNRLREALGDKASNPRFVETLARRGYRFLGPVEIIAPQDRSAAGPGVAQATPPSEDAATETSVSEPILARPAPAGFLDRVLATEQDLPRISRPLVQTLFLLLQLMYLGFYVGALANLAEINDLLSPLPYSTQAFLVVIMTAAILIPVRVFLLCAVLFRAPRLRHKFRTLWRVLLPVDVLWSLAPFLLLHHIPYGLALACVAPLVYSPFAQRSLILMGVGSRSASSSA